MKRQQPAGVLLLLALVMMALVLSASLVLATVIIREIRLAQISDKGITAFYAAETAAEDSVYRMFKLGEDPSVLAPSGVLSGGSTWTRVSKRTDTSFVHDFVSRDETVVVDLYNTANVNDSAGVESFSIEWTSGQSMDVLLSEWDGTVLGSPGAPTICVASPCVVNVPLSNKAYRVAMTVRGTAMTDLMLFVFEGDGGAGAPVAVEIPVTVVATGQYQGARQAVELTVPVPPPWG